MECQMRLNDVLSAERLRSRELERQRDEARSEVMRLQDNDSAYGVGYQRADAAAGVALDRLRQERDEARARAVHFERLARDQQATNAAMVASLQRGLAELRASEAEVARLRNVLINTRRNDGHWYGCWTNDGRSERCSPECALFAETLAATLRQAQGKLGRAPAGESAESEAG
jgi:hypothetical protein